MPYTMRTARQGAGKTQAEMAALMRVSRAVYRRMEQRPDTVTVRQARRFSQITGVDVDEVNFFEPELYLK